MWALQLLQQRAVSNRKAQQTAPAAAAVPSSVAASICVTVRAVNDRQGPNAAAVGAEFNPVAVECRHERNIRTGSSIYGAL